MVKGERRRKGDSNPPRGEVSGAITSAPEGRSDYKASIGSGTFSWIGGDKIK